MASVEEPASSELPIGEPTEKQTLGKRLWLSLKKNALILSLFLAIALGVVVGVSMRQRKKLYSNREVMYSGFLGSLLIRMLKCITIPLFTASVMSALGRLNLKSSGVISLITIAYFLVTSLLSTILGVICVLIFQPGSAGDLEAEYIDVKKTLIVDNFLDVVRNIFPSNLIEATMYTHTTLLIDPKSNKSIPLEDWDFKVNYLEHSTNFVGLIAVSAAIGFAMGYLGEGVRLFTDFITAINDLFINITFLIIAVSAPGVFSLILGQILEVKDFIKTIQQLGMYTLTCIVGLVIVGFVIIPVTYMIFMRKLPFRMLFNSLSAITTAFATASSLATMPTTLKCVEELNHVDPRVSRFVVPLGATVNMDAAALYVTVGPLFLAQMSKIDVSFGHYVGVCITATLASVGAAAVPQSGVIAMLMVFSILNVNPGLLGYIYAMDWLIDRVCTSVNVLGDICASSVIEKLNRKRLETL